MLDAARAEKVHEKMKRTQAAVLEHKRPEAGDLFPDILAGLAEGFPFGQP